MNVKNRLEWNSWSLMKLWSRIRLLRIANTPNASFVIFSSYGGNLTPVDSIDITPQKWDAPIPVLYVQHQVISEKDQKIRICARRCIWYFTCPSRILSPLILFGHADITKSAVVYTVAIHKSQSWLKLFECVIHKLQWWALCYEVTQKIETH